MDRVKTVLVTGASSGIGEAFCHLFARDGYQLVLVARSQNKLSELAQSLRDRYQVNTFVMCYDLSKRDAVPALISQLQQQQIQIDMLINNAGIGAYGDFSTIDLQQHLDTIEINLISLTTLTYHIIPIMRANGAGQILNIASVTAFQACPYMAVYGAVKAYVLHFSEALAVELATDNITVTTLAPGPTKTRFFANANIEPVNRNMLMDPRRVAQKGYDGLRQNRGVVIPGWLNKMGYLISCLLPRRWITQLSARIIKKIRL